MRHRSDPDVSDICFNVEAHGQAIAKAAGTGFNPRCDVAIARITPDGKPLAGSILSNYTGVGGSCAGHIAMLEPRGVSYGLCWITFDYVFNQMRVSKFFGLVPASNARALRFDLSLGFHPDTIVRDVFPDGDMIVLSMYRPECRFLSHYGS